MKQPGWQQPPDVCVHLGLIGAVYGLAFHSAGHEWVCTCGARFVVTGHGKEKKLVQR
jgi:hypothetical protein